MTPAIQQRIESIILPLRPKVTSREYTAEQVVKIVAGIAFKLERDVEPNRQQLDQVWAVYNIAPAPEWLTRNELTRFGAPKEYQLGLCARCHKPTIDWPDTCKCPGRPQIVLHMLRDASGAFTAAGTAYGDAIKAGKDPINAVLLVVPNGNTTTTASPAMAQGMGSATANSAPVSLKAETKPAPAQQPKPAAQDPPRDSGISCYEYLKNLFVAGDRVCTMQIHATNKNPDGTSVTITNFQSLEELVDQSSDFNAAVAKAERDNWNMYVCMNPVTADSWNRKKGNVATIRSVYAEVDYNGAATREEVNKAAAAGEIPKPHCVIESSHGKFQFVWLVEGFTAETQEQLNKSLQQRFNTDEAAVDCVRVLRLPGFKNMKPGYGPNFPTAQIVEWNKGPRYTPADFRVQLVHIPQHTSGDPLPQGEISERMKLMLSHLDELAIKHAAVVPYNGGLKSELKECPWADNHSDKQARGGAYFNVQADGKLSFGCQHNNCVDKHWPQFRDYLEELAGHKLKWGEDDSKVIVSSVPEGKTTADVARESAGAQAQADAAAEASKDAKGSFPTLVPVEDKLSPVLPFDPDFLPDSIKPWLVDVAERMSVPLDFTGICGLTGLAGATGRRVFIHPKQFDKEWKEPLNLCGGIIASSGQTKTPTWKAVLAPLQIVESTWEHAAQEEKIKYLQELQAWKTAVESWKNEVKEIRKRNKKSAVKEPEPEEPLPPMEPIPARRLITTDATLEALHEMMSHNPAGILLLRDELSGWVAEQDKKGYEVAKSFHLTATNGNDYYAMDRIGRGSVKALVCESIFGGFQPDTFREWLAAAKNLEDGTIPRFTLLAWPDEVPTVRVDRPANEAAKEMFYRVVRNIANLKPCALSLSFDQQAQARYDAWYDDLLVRIAKEKNSSKASYMSKLKGCLPRIAGLLQLIDVAASASENDPKLLGEAKVDLRHLEKAISLSRYLESHMHRLYNSIRNPVQVAETELAEHLAAGHLGERFTLRVIHRKHWTGLTVPDIVESALDRLEAKGWVVSWENKMEKTRGRPTVWWKINPIVLQKAA